MDWNEIKAWRKSTRAELIGARLAEPAAQRDVRTRALSAHLEPLVRDLAQPISGYWPLRGEPDLRELLARLAERGLAVALPVADRLGEAMTFRPWRPGMPLARGLSNIPIPDTTDTVQPRIVLAPLVAFDSAGFRLGYGGGFFDRTLATAQPRPLVIGIGHAAARIATVHPQAHDIAMDFIVTEDGIVHVRDGDLVPVTAAEARTAAVALATARGALDPPPATAAYASPACAAGAFPDYFVPADGLSSGELAALLNVLLEAERAGAQVIATFLPDFDDQPAARALLREVHRDEAHNCALLLAALATLGATASAATGDFVGKALAVEGPAPRLRMLNRGQAWVAREIARALPRIAPGATRDMLQAMRESHRLNIERCDQLLAELEQPAPGGPARTR